MWQTSNGVPGLLMLVASKYMLNPGMCVSLDEFFPLSLFCQPVTDLPNSSSQTCHTFVVEIFIVLTWTNV